MVEYGILFALIFRAVYHTIIKQFTNTLLFSFLITLAYAGFDEIHQTFVPTREGSIRDIGIDVIGMLVMLLIIKYGFKHVKKYL